MGLERIISKLPKTPLSMLAQDTVMLATKSYHSREIIPCCVHFVQVFSTTMEGSKDDVLKLLKKMGIKLTADENDLIGKPLMKVVMKKWLPAGDALLQMITMYLPSPVTSQKYRVG